jgi:hypothetical protein
MHKCCLQSKCVDCASDRLTIFWRGMSWERGTSGSHAAFVTRQMRYDAEVRNGERLSFGSLDKARQAGDSRLNGTTR